MSYIAPRVLYAAIMCEWGEEYTDVLDYVPCCVTCLNPHWDRHEVYQRRANLTTNNEKKVYVRRSRNYFLNVLAKVK